MVDVESNEQAGATSCLFGGTGASAGGLKKQTLKSQLLCWLPQAGCGILHAVPVWLLQGHVLRRRVVGSHHHLCRSVHEFIEPYTFPSYHTRILEPYNYYEFGQNYVRTLISFETSVVSTAGLLLLCLLCRCDFRSD